MPVEITADLADRVAGVARLLEGDDPDAALQRLTRLAVSLVPGAAAGALTVADDGGAHVFAASDHRVGELHRLQFADGEGPTVESLSYSEPRHVRDLGDEPRWPRFCQAARQVGFCSCVMLPLRPDRRHPIGAVALYGAQPDAFRGVSYDLALLFAAQGGTALHNAETYAACHHMVTNLHKALESRAIIEQAKGMLHAELGVSADQAFRLLSRRSHRTNRKIRELAAALVSGQIHPQAFQPDHSD